jgi:hypothetical protein
MHSGPQIFTISIRPMPGQSRHENNHLPSPYPCISIGFMPGRAWWIQRRGLRMEILSAKTVKIPTGPNPNLVVTIKSHLREGNRAHLMHTLILVHILCTLPYFRVTSKGGNRAYHMHLSFFCWQRRICKGGLYWQRFTLFVGSPSWRILTGDFEFKNFLARILSGGPRGGAHCFFEGRPDHINSTLPVPRLEK